MLVSELVESEESPENSANDTKFAASASTSRRSSRRGSIEKRVVSVPIKGSFHKMTAPPSDSWAWRKYGQKPIKGSPYPRGYYRCSSSKSCPARKQVERSRVDPNMLLVTYSCEYNHPSRNNNNHNIFTKNTSSAPQEEEEDDDDEKEEEKKVVINPPHQSKLETIQEDNLCEGPMIHGSEFGWFSDFDSSFGTMLETSIFSTQDRITTDYEISTILTMQDLEEDHESLFADLGELPECSTVFRRGKDRKAAEERRHIPDESICLPQICLPS